MFVVVCCSDNRKLIRNFERKLIRGVLLTLRIFQGLFSGEQRQQRLFCKVEIWSWKTSQNNGVKWNLGFFLEKAMAPHFSTLAWKIPWTEEPRSEEGSEEEQVPKPPPKPEEARKSVLARLDRFSLQVTCVRPCKRACVFGPD